MNISEDMRISTNPGAGPENQCTPPPRWYLNKGSKNLGFLIYWPKSVVGLLRIFGFLKFLEVYGIHIYIRVFCFFGFLDF